MTRLPRHWLSLIGLVLLVLIDWIGGGIAKRGEIMVIL